MKKWKPYSSITFLSLAAALLLAGCQSSATGGKSAAADTSANSQSAEASAPPAETVTKILVGTHGSPRPYLFTDENDNLDGYDAAVVREIDSLLPQYEFEYELTDFASIFGGIDSGRYQMGDNNFTRKPEREEKYLFGNEYYVYNSTVAVVRKGYAEIKALEDLGGKKTYIGSDGGFAQIFIENFNETHSDNPINGVYADVEIIKSLQDVADGGIDFTFLEAAMFDAYLGEFPDLKEKLEYVTFTDEETQSIQDPYGWFLFARTDEGQKLADAVDGAIRELAASGRLKELSEQYFGFDSTGR
ncbi:MAG: transporter substrate-binding domain-containing protein [Clostridium sp.]|jgi:ABC-type amino acid transport substrate-binding protein|nr:transporter substrate-binding domain-containing protein [Clostridium sp.]